MRYVMTQQDIDGGVPNDGIYCPIANTINRTCNLQPGIVFVAMTAIWNDKAMRKFPLRLENQVKHKVELPMDAELFRIAFDKGDEVSPIEFDLPVDCDWFKRMQTQGA